jgi:hypothetical protein
MTTREPRWLPRPTGTERPDDPVLTMTGEQKAVLLDVAYYGWALTGYAQAPIGRALSDRRLHPRPGDLVIIPDAMSARTSTASDPHMGVGYLVESRWEPGITEKDWAEWQASGYDDPCPEERVWYVQYGPRAADVCRWENASCQAVPLGGAFADEVRTSCDRYLGLANAAIR